MPRRSSSGRSRPAPRAHSYSRARNPPQPAAPTPPLAIPQRNTGSVMQGLGGVVAEGMAFGTGSAIAHRAVDAVMGPRVIHHETVPSSGPAATPSPVQSVNSHGSDACSAQAQAFQDCINNYGSEISRCQFYIDMLSECRRSSGLVGL
ncbi:hypothetical protein Ancab_028997 [Ancistrocladus abbreviatus]